MSGSEVIDLFGAILPYLKVNDLPGKLINIDTLDGAGNSTQAALLAGYLDRILHIQTVLTKEPTDGTYGSLIRKVLKKELTLDKWALSGERNVIHVTHDMGIVSSSKAQCRVVIATGSGSFKLAQNIAAATSLVGSFHD